MASPFTPELGIRIRISEFKVNWFGTRAELEAEGFIPEATDWPTGKRHTLVQMPTVWFCIHRLKPDGTDPGPDTVYKVEHYSQFRDGLQRRVAKKMREVHTLLQVGGTEWHAEFTKHCEARNDNAFQAFKRNLLGQKKRGRPAKADQTTPTPTTHGEAA